MSEWDEMRLDARLLFVAENLDAFNTARQREGDELYSQWMFVFVTFLFHFGCLIWLIPRFVSLEISQTTYGPERRSFSEPIAHHFFHYQVLELHTNLMLLISSVNQFRDNVISKTSRLRPGHSSATMRNQHPSTITSRSNRVRAWVKFHFLLFPVAVSNRMRASLSISS